MAEMGNLVACVRIRTENEVKAEALREAADAWYGDHGPWNQHGSEATWLRERADELDPSLSPATGAPAAAGSTRATQAASAPCALTTTGVRRLPTRPEWQAPAEDETMVDVNEKPNLMRDLLDGELPREVMGAPTRLRQMVREVGPLQPVCSCDDCLEMRMWREVHPHVKPSALEQFHSLDEGFRLLGKAITAELARLGAALGRFAARVRA